MTQFVEQDVITADNVKICSRIFYPINEPIGSVLIVPAMGVTQDYYDSFATWLAEQGFLTVTFDYRGIGLSQQHKLCGFQTTIIDWANLDCGAMINAISTLLPGKPLYWIGHSLGSQILPFVPNNEKITKIINIGGGSGYWRYNSPPLNRRAWWLWNIVVPLAVFTFGYFPGKRIGIVGDLPKGVILQWRQWCLNPKYIVGVESEASHLFASVNAPILSLSFTDDEFMSAQSIDSLNSFYINSPRTINRINPAEIGMKRIGHFGFFKLKNKDPLWAEYLLPYLKS